ncbi:unnamed protein product [Wuchereria bancrofti]|uniref:Uncharacterized protein n=1 Tax=Wuchereria bancrofti TaxID=6293 RepID=A0A3P7E7U7_WUCBA|nr:unnamed protein product [Wuchereria bancrofti]
MLELLVDDKSDHIVSSPSLLSSYHGLSYQLMIMSLRVLVGRQRSESMGSNEKQKVPWPPINKPLRRVQV